MTKSVIIVAGGKGKRMESNIAKQFIEIGCIPILMRTISAFYNYDNNITIVVVLLKKEIEFWKNLCQQHNFNIAHKVVEGGKERFFSVKNGLQYVDTELIAIHDGVRPFVSAQTIENCFASAEQFGAAIPVMKIEESIRFVEENRNYAVERKNYVMVQTPQIFKSEIIKSAYNQLFEERFTDDASVVENMGQAIFLTEGNRENIKITTIWDLKIAETFISEK
ncbi:MAG: 2-C-methyl-D-erythritol 4-phosphate cytidylyltransferase [Paludibacter sp.]|nr:2-C-methyl-D-erythritol 4-phosphate cytidylyltransferase [Paludibacter sp.]